MSFVIFIIITDSEVFLRRSYGNTNTFKGRMFVVLVWLTIDLAITGRRVLGLGWSLKLCQLWGGAGKSD